MVGSVLHVVLSWLLDLVSMIIRKLNIVMLIYNCISVLVLLGNSFTMVFGSKVRG